MALKSALALLPTATVVVGGVKTQPEESSGVTWYVPFASFRKR